MLDILLNPTTVSWATVTLLTIGVTLWVVLLPGGRRLPPGPRSLPFLGNIHQIPADFQEKTFLTWGRKYGDIVFAKFFHRPVVITNSLEVARDLLERRSQYYSNRPIFTMMVELYVITVGIDSI